MSDIAGEILGSIGEITRSFAERSRAFSREVGLTVPQVTCLKAITAAGAEVTVGEVARAVALTPATVSRILDRLEISGFVERQRTAEDRRKVCLVLTEAGRKRAEAAVEPFEEELAVRLDRLPSDEQEALLRALSRVRELVDDGDARH
jgi:DNA-binding MarR family transcriptional regulator